MRVTTAIGACGLVLLLLASVALPQAGAQSTATGSASVGARGPALGGATSSYQLDWWAADAGGFASGGQYTMECAAGRSEAGVLSSERYTLSGGIPYDVPEPATPAATPTSTTPPPPTPSPTGPAPGAHRVYLPVTLRE
jgi:hypothetical protein